ncbi:hypothetical protein CVT25_002163 [Psilocybe cyanescens]|uniref:Uncharacterized protein n=1 Tax=Psilocybe cyanescens TaxID=93625 RepID=A0A409XUK2_PSICY|nr:hypothetical protein CVT25_002163 [Psilocybe cyanescens]
MTIQVAKAAEHHKAFLKAREEQKKKEKTKKNVRECTQKPKNKVSTRNSHAETASATMTAEEDNICKKKRSAPSKPNLSASVRNIKSKVIVSSNDNGEESTKNVDRITPKNAKPGQEDKAAATPKKAHKKATAGEAVKAGSSATPDSSLKSDHNADVKGWVDGNFLCNLCLKASQRCLVLTNETAQEGHACWACKQGKKQCPLANTANIGLHFKTPLSDSMLRQLGEHPGCNDLGNLLAEILQKVRQHHKPSNVDELLGDILHGVPDIQNKQQVLEKDLQEMKGWMGIINKAALFRMIQSSGFISPTVPTADDNTPLTKAASNTFNIDPDATVIAAHRKPGAASSLPRLNQGSTSNISGVVVTTELLDQPKLFSTDSSTSMVTDDAGGFTTQPVEKPNCNSWILEGNSEPATDTPCFHYTELEPNTLVPYPCSLTPEARAVGKEDNDWHGEYEEVGYATTMALKCKMELEGNKDHETKKKRL